MRRFVALALLVVLAGCKTMSIPFIHMKPDYAELPADALKSVAQAVEQAVAKGDREAKIADQGGIVVNGEGVKQAIRTRAARAELLDKLLTAGYACEDRNGLVRVVRSKDYRKNTTSRQRDRDALLVMGENNDRWTIYEGVVKDSKLRGGALSAVQDAFHQARVGVLAEGQKYEEASGDVVVKKR